MGTEAEREMGGRLKQGEKTHQMKAVATRGGRSRGTRGHTAAPAAAARSRAVCGVCVNEGQAIK